MYLIFSIVFYLFILYSIIYQVLSITMLSKCRKIKMDNKITGLQVAQSLLKNNNINIYVVKTEKRSHYDPKRNVIRLDNDDYNNNSLGAVINSIYLALSAININNYKNRFMFILAGYGYTISSAVCLLGLLFRDINVMAIGLIFMIIILIFKYQQSSKEVDIYNDSIDKIKKEYKLKDEDIEIISKKARLLINNELSINMFK